MGLPSLTHLQCLILSILMDGEQSGRDVRAQLAKHGDRKTGPAFYQLMSRLEDSGSVEGWYDQKIVDGQIIKQRRYKITGDGITAVKETQAFYADLPRHGLRGGLSHA